MNFNKDFYEGNKGKVMLQLSKTFKGDSRFQLDDRFNDDIDVEKLPQKFKQIAQKGMIQKVNKKTKPIHKDKPLLIQRFEPGTKKAQQNIKKAEGQKKYIQGLKKHQQKKKKKMVIEKGIDKVKKADKILGITSQEGNEYKLKPSFQMVIKGDRKQAFKRQQFKLFE